MSAFSWILIVLGLVGLAVIVVYLAVKRPEEGTWKWLVGAAGAVIAIVIGAITLGKVKPKNPVRKRERKVAPPVEEMVETDIKSDQLDEKIEESKQAEKDLDNEAEDTDGEKEDLEDRAAETDDKIKDIEERKDEPRGEDPDDPDGDQPDPRVFERLRDS